MSPVGILKKPRSSPCWWSVCNRSNEATAADNVLCVMAGVALAQREPLTADGLQQRLSAFAEQYKAVGPIARMINHDLAFPRNASEYRIMNGFGIIWVTAHSQESTEFSLQNMRMKPVNHNVIEVPPHSSFFSTEEDATVALVLGQHRMDYVCLVPLL